jgi:hypothetical protein
MDGVIMFDNLPYLKRIKNAIYADVINNFRPKILKYAAKMGEDLFNKYCYFAFRTKFEDKNNKKLGKIYTVVTFCLNKQYNEIELNKFTKDYRAAYSSFLYKEKNLMKVQEYRLKENIMIQYYDPKAIFDEKNLEPPNFYTSFAVEGLVLNAEPNYDPTKVKYSFRFDQVVDCQSLDAAVLKSILPKHIADLYKPDPYCISYLVDWQMKALKNMFCSTYKNEVKMKTDIKIFQSTMYSFCLATKAKNFIEYLKKVNYNLTQFNLYFLEQVSVILFLQEIIEKNLELYIDQTTKFYTDVMELKNNAKEYRDFFLNMFEKDYFKDSSLNCKKVLEGALEKKKVFNDGGPNDFEAVDRAQENNENSVPSQTIKLINGYVFAFCKELKGQTIGEASASQSGKQEISMGVEASASQSGQQEISMGGEASASQSGQQEISMGGNASISQTEKQESSENGQSINILGKNYNVQIEQTDMSMEFSQFIKFEIVKIKKMTTFIINYCKKNAFFSPNDCNNVINIILNNYNLFLDANLEKSNLDVELCNELRIDPEGEVRKLERSKKARTNKFIFKKCSPSSICSPKKIEPKKIEPKKIEPKKIEPKTPDKNVDANPIKDKDEPEKVIEDPNVSYLKFIFYLLF